MVKIEAVDSGANRTAFTCSVRKGDGASDWRKIASVSTLKHADRAQELIFIHSSVEGFWRNDHSATLSRRAEFSDVATKGAKIPDWTYATRAYFSDDATESPAVDAGRLGERKFFLQTGDTTTNKTTKLFTVIDKRRFRSFPQHNALDPILTNAPAKNMIKYVILINLDFSNERGSYDKHFSF